MLSRHFRIALRSIVRNKGYDAIHLCGLSVGLACFFLIALFVHDELSYDRFHHDAERIHRVVVDQVRQDGTIVPRINTPEGLGLVLAQQIPEIEAATRIMPSYWGKRLLTRQARIVSDEDYLMVDSTFFKVFSLSFLQGDETSAMSDGASIVLTRSTAQQLFGEEDPLGKAVTLDQSQELQVRGVVEDPPRQSHFSFSFLLPLPARWDGCWSVTCGHAYTYIKLKPAADIGGVEGKIQQLVRAHEPEPSQDRYFTQPLAGIDGIHLASHRMHELQVNSNKLYVELLIAGGLFILLIAGINYVNLATARSMLRAREIGVRKVAGASRAALVGQFLVEAVVLSVIAGVVAIGLAQLVLPQLNAIIEKDLSLFAPGSQWLWVMSGAVVILFGVASGLYPALYLSFIRPMAAIRVLQTSRHRRFGLRQGLVVFQFALSALLLVGVNVVGGQLEFLQAANLGYNADQVVVISDFRKVARRDENFTVRRRLQALSGVISVGSATDLVGTSNTWGAVRVPGSNHRVNVSSASVDYGYLQTLGVELKEGRFFAPEFETSQSPLAVILNETAVAELGLTGPGPGQQILDDHGRTATIVGVVKDFHFASLREEIGPHTFFFSPKAGEVVLKLQAGTVAATLKQIEATWSRFVPGSPLDFYFLDEAIDQHYKSERSFRTLFTAMSALSLVIAVLGMFGLVTFAAERRTREIGVRKVLGASVASIVGLVSNEFIQLVVLANLMVWPLAYWAMGMWLQGFAYHIQMGVSVFATAGGIALLVAAVAVSGQAARAALANPIESLRCE